MSHPGMADLLLAMDAPAHAAGPSFVQNLIPLVALLAIFYFLLYRPQAQKQKEHEAMVQALKKDDRVVTQGGLHGKVAEAARRGSPSRRTPSRRSSMPAAPPRRRSRRHGWTRATGSASDSSS